MQSPRFSFPDFSRHETVRRVQLGCALLFTLLSVALHGEFMLHGYPLWRDEVNSVGIASMPTLGELWASLSYDSSPVLWPLLVRAWIFYGPGQSDLSLRILGFVVQMLLLGALWFNARALARRAPVLSLFLVGCQPAFVLWPSLRSYGLGAALLLGTFGCLWKALERPTFPWVAATFALAVSSVQCLYTNLILLAAICVAGIAVCLYQKQGRRAMLPCAVFGVAALSLLLYIPTFKHIAEWQMLTVTSIKFSTIFATLAFTLKQPVSSMLWIWMALAAIFILGAIFHIATSSLKIKKGIGATAEDIESNRILIYCFITSLLSFGAMIWFLQRSGRNTFAWHYTGVIILCAVCLDASWPFIVRNFRAQLGFVALMPVVALAFFPLARQGITVRRTNLDFMASHLTKYAQPNDLIIISPWYFGITFKRYYHGTATWVTAPDMREFRIHRYDLMKNLMMKSDEMQRIQAMIKQTLTSGHSVWLVGSFKPSLGEDIHYDDYCTNQVLRSVNQYGVRRVPVPMHSLEVYSNFEVAYLELVQGQ